MDENRVWAFEQSLWTGDAEHYRELIDDACVMVLPQQPFVLTGAEAIAAVADTPRWTEVAFSDQQVVRPHEGLIAIAYKAEAKREGAAGYTAYDDDAAAGARRLARRPTPADAAHRRRLKPGRLVVGPCFEAREGISDGLRPVR